MTPDHIELLRRLALNEGRAMTHVMGGGPAESGALDAKTAALVRIAALMSTNCDPSTWQWALDLGLAAGVEDEEVFNTLLIVAPLVGVARLNSALPHLMAGLEIDVVEGLSEPNHLGVV